MAFKITKFGPKRERRDFSEVTNTLELKDLLEIQKKSYRWFCEQGIKEVFRDIFPVESFSRSLSLEFVDYCFDEPRYSVKECKDKETTFSAPIKVNVRLKNHETGEVIEQEVFLGDMPMMTEAGTFVINGVERVIVSQLVRSPGVYSGKEIDKNGRLGFTSLVMPSRGTWLEFENDARDVIYVRIDRTRKVPLTTILRAFGLSKDEEMLDLFGEDEYLLETLKKDSTKNKDDALLEIYEKLRPGEPAILENAKNQIITRFFDELRYDLAKVGRYKFNKKLDVLDRLLDKTLAEDLKYGKKVIAKKDELITKSRLEELRPYFRSRYEFKNVVISKKEFTDFVLESLTVEGKTILEKGKRFNKEALELLEPYFDNGYKLVDVVVNGSIELDQLNMKDLKVNDEVILKSGRQLDEEAIEKINQCFVLGYGYKEVMVNEELDTYNKVQEVTIYNPTKKGKTLKVIGCDQTTDVKRLTISDLYATTSYYLNMLQGVGHVDEIDHLGNRRIRQVGELLQNQFRIGVTRMERVIRERMTTQEIENITPKKLINIRPVTAAMKEFFGSSQLSQFMDQENPIAELTNKRRLSALGPGGLSRDRASMDVRDVNYTHYGRICPIESPEGPNIGLITSLASYAKVNEYGFIMTPYRKVVKGVITDKIDYLTADEEDDFKISVATIKTDAHGKITQDEVPVRYRSEHLILSKNEIDYVDVSPQQIVSITTSCIPFLEHDDANRALMGANMQRQGVPLLEAEAPYIGTGVEYIAAKDSGVCIVSKTDGIVDYVDAKKIIIKDKKESQEYILATFERSNQGTCYHQKPIVKYGDKIKAGDVIADGPSVDQGELALGKNVVVAFMAWEGYNYEDAVILNERLVKDDVYTSIQITNFEIQARETKLGPEEITRDIPNVSEEARKNLDENGVIQIGTEVKEGDILVGKVTPKGMVELTSEEKLLHAIFGEKTREVRDTSLRVDHGVSGIVHDIKIFTKKDNDELPAGVNKVIRVYIAKKRKVQVGDKMAGRHGNKGVISLILPEEDMPYMPDGTPVDVMLNPLGVPSRMNLGQILELHLGMAAKKLNIHVATPVFDGAKDKEMKAMLKEAGMDDDGKTYLYDGRTGKRFDNRISVGVMYMLKLHHMVVDKLHARSTGPYSLVTQQPLGGKAQFGGQRFGEMEVWALYAYGAAHTLQEILTVKSDDVVGRVKVYEALVKGNQINQAGVPESFRVLVKEFQALGLDVSTIDLAGKVEGIDHIFKEEDKENTSLSIEEIDSKLETEEEPVVEESEFTEEEEVEFDEDFTEEGDI